MVKVALVFCTGNQTAWCASRSNHISLGVSLLIRKRWVLVSPSPEPMSTLWLEKSAAWHKYPSNAPESVSVGVSKTCRPHSQDEPAVPARLRSAGGRPPTPRLLPTTSTSFAAVGCLSPLRVHPPLRARNSQGASLGPNASGPRLSRPAPEPKRGGVTKETERDA